VSTPDKIAIDLILVNEALELGSSEAILAVADELEPGEL